MSAPPAQLSAAEFNTGNNKKVFEKSTQDTEYFEQNKTVIRNHLRQDME